VRVFDLLRERPEVQARKVEVPPASQVRRFISSGRPLSNDGLKVYMAEHPDPELERAWAWTTGVNQTIADLVYGVPPFPHVGESLEFLRQRADMVVASATPSEALTREWEEHDIAKFPRVIAGQEMGSKKEILARAAKGKYPPNHILMIGDAPGDMEAARANGALFFPINPGHEEESWARFYREGAKRFLAGEFAGAYEATLVAEFETLLPDTPPWKR
jgi:phosphoglycolate phosphatase-like HAD superfamily hydrolase